MVDTLKGIGPGDIILLAGVQFKVYKVDVKVAERVYRKIRYQGDKDHTITDHRSVYPHETLSRFVAETMIVKSVPTTWSGPAKSSDCVDRTMARYVSGDQELYHEWVAQNRPREYTGGAWDMTDATVAHDPDKPKSLVGSKRYKKMDLICAVILAHGPSTKDDILRRVCQLEGKPWVVGSNSEYFTNPRQIEDSIKEFGKIGAKKGWYVTEKGVSRGSQVLADVGLDIVKSIA